MNPLNNIKNLLEDLWWDLHWKITEVIDNWKYRKEMNNWDEVEVKPKKKKTKSKKKKT